MAIRKTIKLIDALAIRDTNDSFSAVINTVDMLSKTILVENDLSVDLNIFLQVSARSSFTKFDETPVVIVIIKNKTDYVTLNDYGEFFRLRIKAPSGDAGTTGDVTAWLMGIDL